MRVLISLDTPEGRVENLVTPLVEVLDLSRQTEGFLARLLQSEAVETSQPRLPPVTEETFKRRPDLLKKTSMLDLARGKTRKATSIITRM